MKHHCHALGCKAPCPPKHLMCGMHWSQVPDEMQREVYRTVKMRDAECNATWAPWWRAQARAIHHVGMLQQPHPAGARWLEREMAFADLLEKRG